VSTRSNSQETGVGGETHQQATEKGAQLTTNHGVPISDNQNQLKAGARGPVLLEDFVLREKIFHFDHERIPERIVHARGSAAHGYFELTDSLSDITTADIFQRKGEKTPLFARFSTVAGGAGSVDTPRDVRGFAVKFYTKQGNWDLVGNNIPVFFIQDAIKFPDLIHAVKMEADRGYPQAASAHDTFWDFVSLMPESTHMLMWAMSDRTIPRTLRNIEGFGIHTFRFVSAQGKSTFVKFHWKPKLGLQSTLWDEAVKIAGADPDFHRRDLFESIDSGAFPEWELGVQLFDQKFADSLPYDVLDSTKLIPEELLPIRIVGRMVLDRNPDNFFAETEQVAFCPSHIVPGIDFTADCFHIWTRSTRGSGPATSIRFPSTSPRAVRSPTSSAMVTCRPWCPRAAPTTSPTVWPRTAKSRVRARRHTACIPSPSRSMAKSSGCARRRLQTTTVRPGCSSARCTRQSRPTWRPPSCSS
jgi:catalase